MISALCRGGFLEDAKQLACEFEAKYDKYDVVILNTMLCAYCRTGEMENVMKMMKKMDESAISPDWNTFHILIKYFSKEKLYLLAFRTMEDMHRKGHEPEEVGFSYYWSAIYESAVSLNKIIYLHFKGWQLREKYMQGNIMASYTIYLASLPTSLTCGVIGFPKVFISFCLVFFL